MMRLIRWVCVGSLVGCLTGDPPQFRATRVDLDGDGFDSVATGGDDCDDENRLVNPARTEQCGDGIDNNCDGRVDDAGTGDVPAYVDWDGDGYGSEEAVFACPSRLEAASGVAGASGDCDDTRAEVNPSAVDVCNGVDDDCDGDLDEDEVAFGSGRAFDDVSVAIGNAFDIELCPTLETLEVVGAIDVTGAAGLVSIRGPGPDRLTLRPRGSGSVVRVSGGRLILEGVTVEGATARPLVVEDRGALELRNVVVRNSEAGGVRVAGSTSGSQAELRVVNSQLIGNGTAGVDGGAIRAERGFRIEVVESEIYNNVADLGGGIAVDGTRRSGEAWGSRSLLVQDSLIAGNVATEGGGLYLHTVDEASIPRTLVSGNVAVTLGGGVAVYEGTLRGDAETDIAGNGAEEGGGIFAANSGIESLRVGGNTASKRGGGVMLGSSGSASSYLFDALVHDNTAQNEGGGLYVLPGQPQTTFVSAARFQGNQADSGGGVYLSLLPVGGRSSTLSLDAVGFGLGNLDNVPNDIEISSGVDGIDQVGVQLISVFCDGIGCR